MKHATGYYVNGVRDETMKKLEAWLIQRDYDLKGKYIQADVEFGKRFWTIRFKIVTEKP